MKSHLTRSSGGKNTPGQTSSSSSAINVLAHFSCSVDSPSLQHQLKSPMKVKQSSSSNVKTIRPFDIRGSNDFQLESLIESPNENHECDEDEVQYCVNEQKQLPFLSMSKTSSNSRSSSSLSTHLVKISAGGNNPEDLVSPPKLQLPKNVEQYFFSLSNQQKANTIPQSNNQSRSSLPLTLPLPINNKDSPLPFSLPLNYKHSQEEREETSEESIESSPASPNNPKVSNFINLYKSFSPNEKTNNSIDNSCSSSNQSDDFAQQRQLQFQLPTKTICSFGEIEGLKESMPPLKPIFTRLSLTRQTSGLEIESSISLRELLGCIPSNRELFSAAPNSAKNSQSRQVVTQIYDVQSKKYSSSPLRILTTVSSLDKESLAATEVVQPPPPQPSSKPCIRLPSPPICKIAKKLQLISLTSITTPISQKCSPRNEQNSLQQARKSGTSSKINTARNNELNEERRSNIVISTTTNNVLLKKGFETILTPVQSSHETVVASTPTSQRFSEVVLTTVSEDKPTISSTLLPGTSLSHSQQQRSAQRLRSGLTNDSSLSLIDRNKEKGRAIKASSFYVSSIIDGFSPSRQEAAAATASGSTVSLIVDLTDARGEVPRKRAVAATATAKKQAINIAGSLENQAAAARDSKYFRTTSFNLQISRKAKQQQHHHLNLKQDSSQSKTDRIVSISPDKQFTISCRQTWSKERPKELNQRIKMSDLLTPVPAMAEEGNKNSNSNSSRKSFSEKQFDPQQQQRLNNSSSYSTIKQRKDQYYTKIAQNSCFFQIPSQADQPYLISSLKSQLSSGSTVTASLKTPQELVMISQLQARKQVFFTGNKTSQQQFLQSMKGCYKESTIIK